MPAPFTLLPCSYKRRTEGPMPCRREEWGGEVKESRSGQVGAETMEDSEGAHAQKEGEGYGRGERA